MSCASDSHVWRPVENRRQRRRLHLPAHHIRVRAFAVFGDETVDPRGDNRQRHRAELEHGVVESAEPRSSDARSRAASKTTAVAMIYHKRLVSWNRPLCDRTRAGVRSSKAAGHDCLVKTARKCDPHSALGAKSNSNSYWSDQAGPTKGGAGLASSHLQAGVI
jgi:hypothetical protein